MKRSRLCYRLIQLLALVWIFQLSSCKKSDDLYVNSVKDQRIVEILKMKNGKNFQKDEFSYNNGKLLLHYGSEWNDHTGWERSARSIYKCWTGNFMATTYLSLDSNWVPTLEERAIFTDGKPLEVTHSIYRTDTMLMMPLQKWKCTYEGEKIVLCEIQSYLAKGWESVTKTENIYAGDQLQRINSYSLIENNWVLDGYTKIYYQNNLMKEISKFKIHEKAWTLKEKYKFQYTGQMISQSSCYKPCMDSDSLFLDCTTHYEYDEYNKLVYQLCSGDGIVMEKFFTYEDSCGNYKATIGEISDVLNFPREIPLPLKSSGIY